jgi:hypothetical protein
VPALLMDKVYFELHSGDVRIPVQIEHPFQ